MTFLRIILLALWFLAGAQSVQAQGIPNTVGGLELTPSTSNPSPGQNVTITARSYSVDINSATLTWTVDGKTLEKGIGSTVITVKAPVLGKKTTVGVSAVTPDGTSFINELVLTSGSIDMIIEADGYRPATFAGKLPAIYQNTIKIIAVPHIVGPSGIEADPKTLVYQWEQNGNALESASGYGKQSVTIPGTLIPRPYVISVMALTRDGNAQGAGFIAVNPGSPSVVFYKNDPLYGPLYNNAITGALYLGSQREAGVLAVPYGFNVPVSGLGDLVLAWSINDRARPELSQSRSVTLRAPDASAGSSDISLGITSTKNILQKASGSFRVIFSASATSSPLTF